MRKPTLHHLLRVSLSTRPSAIVPAPDFMKNSLFELLWHLACPVRPVLFCLCTWFWLFTTGLSDHTCVCANEVTLNTIVHAIKINHMLEIWDFEPHNILAVWFLGRRKGLEIEAQANDSTNQAYIRSLTKSHGLQSLMSLPVGNTPSIVASVCWPQDAFWLHRERTGHLTLGTSQTAAPLHLFFQPILICVLWLSWNRNPKYRAFLNHVNGSNELLNLSGEWAPSNL